MLIDDAQVDILVVDDTVENIKLLSQLLSAEGYRVTGAASGSAALRICGRKKLDLILLDIMMPNMDGYEVCSRLKAQAETQDIPIIFLSALDSVQDKVRAFQVGAADYIQKPFEATEVLARVKNHSQVILLQRKLIARNKELKLLADTDGLTGISNRRKMDELGNSQKAPYSVILFDVDDFKRVNDRYGHHIGDKELIEVARITSRQVAEQGHVARWGGEEFLILLPNQNVSQGQQIAESIMGALHQSENVLSTASFGVVDTDASMSFSEAVTRADLAMYQAKHSGKNRVVATQTIWVSSSVTTTDKA